MTSFKPIIRMWISILAITSCFFFGINASNASAAQVTLAWDANTESDLAGYRIHYGTASGSYSVHTDVHNVTSYTVTGLTDGQTYYFAATAYNSSGNESGYSSQVSYSVPAANGAPSAPAAPSGPASALVNASASFSTSATDPNGDTNLQYRFDWGGGVVGSWGPAAQAHIWTAAGQYAVKAQARDSLGLESAWSGARTVTISDDPKAAGNAPDAPVLVSPVNDAPAKTMAELKTGAFRTAVAGATHAKTRWQVIRDDDDICVLDNLSTTALTRITVPKLILEEGTTYFWQAQFIDSKGVASEWSTSGYFTTEITGRDLNTNGIPDAQEVSATTDLDKDGVMDNQQKTIKSVKMAGTSILAGVSIKGVSTALAIESVESEDPQQTGAYASAKPSRMPFGLVNFKIAVAKPGDQAKVRIYFSQAAPYFSKWYKYDSVAGKWSDFSKYAKFASDRRSVTLTLTDGGPGDADGVKNGAIVDPAGIVEPHDAATGGSSSTHQRRGWRRRL